MSKFEPTDASAAVAGGVAAAARSVLSDEFVNSGKSPASGDKPADAAVKGVAAGIAEAIKPGDSSSPAVKAGAGIAAGIAEALTQQKPADSNDRTPSPSLGKLLGDAIKNGTNNDQRSELPKLNDHGTKIYDSGMDIIRHWDKAVTEKNRAEAKEALGQGLSELIPDADKALLKTMQGALIDGNLDKLKGALGSLSGDPERMEKFLKEINGQLKREGAGVELTSDGKGNVLVYEKHGNTAVSINAKTGETTLRAVERQNDGSMLLKPGEIINRKPAEVMKNIGDEATRGITGMNYRFNKYEYKGVLEQLYNVPRSGGGGGGGDSGSNKIVPSAPGHTSTLENLLKESKKNGK